jgi:hypothetical protein
MSGEVQTTQQPVNKDHKTEVKTFDSCDYVTVAGLDENKAGAGNRARFLNQAIRTLCENKKVKRDQKDQCIYFMFKGTETNIGAKAHEELRKVVERRHKATYKILDSSQELVDFVNTRLKEKRMIKKWIFLRMALQSILRLDMKWKKIRITSSKARTLSNGRTKCSPKELLSHLGRVGQELDREKKFLRI